MSDTPLGNGLACSDCTALLANGETDGNWTEEEESEYLAAIAANDSPDIRVTLGLLADEHENDCPNITTDENGEREWEGSADCYCEITEFTWSGCDICARPGIAGYRHAVTFWTIERERT